MPRKATPITALSIRQARPDDFPMWDGKGLHLIRRGDALHWRLKYTRPDGRENRLALGAYPEVGLAEARARRDAARALLRDGVDPAEDRKAQREEAEQAARGTVTAVCADWIEFKKAAWSSESARKAEYVTRTYLLPKLGALPVATLASKDCAPVLRALAERAPDLARKATQYLSGIVRHAIRAGLREDGRLLVLDGVLPKADRGHIAAATLPEEIAAVLRGIHAYPSTVTRCALLLCAYTGQRPGTVAAARWDELADDGSEWRIPAAKMKTRHAHIVPLPKQARALLEEMRPYSAGRDHIFPPLARQQTPHLHRDALSAALRRMGFEGKHATHGFRGMLRTAGRERLGIAADVLEAQLAHAKRDAVQKAYDRTTFGAERRKAMQRWADWLDQLAAGKGADVVAMKRRAASRP